MAKGHENQPEKTLNGQSPNDLNNTINKVNIGL